MQVIATVVFDAPDKPAAMAQIKRWTMQPNCRLHVSFQEGGETLSTNGVGVIPDLPEVKI